MARHIDTDILAKIVFDKWQECDELKHIIPAIRNAVMCASTADVVEQKKGKWKEICSTQDWQFTYEHYRCTNCGLPSECAFRFCPNCGAQMDERREDG